MGWVVFDVIQDMTRSVDNLGAQLSQRKEGRGTDFAARVAKDQLRKTVEAIHPPRMELEVVEVIQETATTRTFRMKRTDGDLPPFRAGQYVSLGVELQGVRTSRPYSIASAPGDDHIDLTVRDVVDGFVAPHLLSHIEVGGQFVSSGPQGHFHHEPLCHGRELVFLAGGSGITPFMSMIRDQARRGWPCRITLLYGSRSEDDVIFDAQLRELAEAAEAFTYVPVISEAGAGYDGRQGLLDAACLGEVVGDVAGKTFYLCGPPAMFDFCQPVLEEIGVPSHRIKRELYGPPADVTGEPGWPTDVAGDAVFQLRLGEHDVPARAGESLLCSLERAGIVPPSACRSGECSVCRCRVVEGDVFTVVGAGVRESDRELGYIHPCVSFPISDVRLQVSRLRQP
jgi:glycine betaine catabolism B